MERIPCSLKQILEFEEMRLFPSNRRQNNLNLKDEAPLVPRIQIHGILWRPQIEKRFVDCSFENHHEPYQHLAMHNLGGILHTPEDNVYHILQKLDAERLES